MLSTKVTSEAPRDRGWIIKEYVIPSECEGSAEQQLQCVIAAKAGIRNHRCRFWGGHDQTGKRDLTCLPATPPR